MTCFWDGLLLRISANKINERFGTNFYGRVDKREFILLLQKHAKYTVDVLWNENEFSQKALEENLEWVKNYNVNGIQQGHYCGSSDPFLILICQLFCMDIYHNYNEAFIKYTNKKNKSGMILSVMSNRDHFW
jgi:hypothetical protein